MRPGIISFWAIGVIKLGIVLHQALHGIDGDVDHQARHALHVRLQRANLSVQHIFHLLPFFLVGGNRPDHPGSHHLRPALQEDQGPAPWPGLPGLHPVPQPQGEAGGDQLRQGQPCCIGELLTSNEENCEKRVKCQVSSVK